MTGFYKFWSLRFFVSLVLVNFTASCYDIEVNETEAIVRVSVFGEFDTNFRVNVIAAASDQSEQSKFMTSYLLHSLYYTS